MSEHHCRIMEFADHDIIIPFICHQCGNCCRGYYPTIDSEMLPEIERTIGEPIKFIQERLASDCEAYSSGQPADCLFLDISGRCRIHDIRPGPCRSFPALLETGAGKVKCPGHRELQEIIKLFNSIIGFSGLRMPSSLKKPRAVPKQEIPHILLIMQKACFSDKLFQEFIVLNGLRA